jgi:hypothetical protein
MYQASVPVFTRMLNNLSTFLDRAQAHADAKKFDSAVFTTLRLAPDMLPFTAQVLIACDTAKLAVARIAKIEAPKNDDKEASLGELKERIASTLAFIATIKPEQLDGTEAETITMKRASGDVTMTAQDYLLHFAHPNMYFHITTAYDLLRQGGVELGKRDYLGPNK